MRSAIDQAGLADQVRTWAEEGLSTRQISRRLADEHGVVLSHAAIGGWLNRQPERYCRVNNNDEYEAEVERLETESAGDIQAVMSELNPRQARFVEEYLIDLCATRAAKDAGYSPLTAAVQGSRLLTQAKIQRAIEAGKTARSKRVELDQDWVLKRLQTISDRCTQAIQVLDSEGKPTGEWRFDAAGANRATELIGKHLGLFTDRVEHSGSIGMPEIQSRDDVQRQLAELGPLPIAPPQERGDTH